MNRNSWRRSALLATACLMPGLAGAQQLAVQGKTPANPILIVSVPDAGKLWTKYSRSPLGQVAERHRKEQAALPEKSVAMNELARIEQQLGMSFAPEDLFGQTITGFDFYVAEAGDGTSLAASIAFVNGDQPNAILDQLKKDAKGARGVSGGYAATQVQEEVSGGTRKLSLPAFNIYLAAEGNVLFFSQSPEVLESTLSNGGRAIFTSDYFKTFMDGLPTEEGDAWFFGEASQLQTLSPKMTTLPVGQSTAAALLRMETDHIKLSTFVPTAHMEPIARRFALTAPPPGDVGVLQYFPQNPLLAYASNHFDGLIFLEGLLDIADMVPAAAGTGDTLVAAIEESGRSGGPDLKNDLLANIGPDFGFVVSRLGLEAAAIQPDVELALVCNVKDPDRFATVLEALEQLVGQGAAPDSFLRETYNDTTIVSPPTMPIAWTLTPESTFLIAMSVQNLKDTLDIGRGASNAFTASSQYQEAAQHLSPNQNDYFTFSVGRMLESFGSQVEAMETSGTMVLEALQTISDVTVTTSYPRAGKQQEILIQMK